jgi:antitoxin ParD1/3/4
MMRSASITLDEHSSRFVDEQVSRGKFASAADVVKAALQLLEEDEAQIERLRAALIEGEQSGEATEFDFDAFLAGKNAS